MASGKDAARDVRYGRRGGGWIPDGAGKDTPTSLAMTDAELVSALLNIVGNSGEPGKTVTAEQRAGIIYEAAIRIRNKENTTR